MEVKASYASLKCSIGQNPMCVTCKYLYLSSCTKLDGNLVVNLNLNRADNFYIYKIVIVSSLQERKGAFKKVDVLIYLAILP